VINGLHALIFSTDAAADRAFLRDVLGFAHVDDGDGWLIFRMPPAELGVHPMTDPAGAYKDPRGTTQHEIYLMCDDIEATVAELGERGVEVAEKPTDKGYGIEAGIRLPGGGVLRVYEPRHSVAKDL